MRSLVKKKRIASSFNLVAIKGHFKNLLSIVLKIAINGKKNQYQVIVQPEKVGPQYNVYNYVLRNMFTEKIFTMNSEYLLNACT